MLVKMIQEKIGHDVIVLIGAPCSGKSTQSKILGKALQLPYLSPGDLFRAEVANGTALGQQLAAYMDSGETIPNELTTTFLTAKFNEPLYRNGMIIDGFPRNFSHLAVLDKILTNTARRIFAAIYLDVSKSQLDERRAHRCRYDDNTGTAERRYTIFIQDTVPLINQLDQEKKLIKVRCCSESPEEVTERLLTELSKL
ncbi:hypothetical protein I4U23_016805 [Adineta vaga]|nr:hypothetical protein I4U23_016805 [Adineta vaga]